MGKWGLGDRRTRKPIGLGGQESGEGLAVFGLGFLLVLFCQRKNTRECLVTEANGNLEEPEPRKHRRLGGGI